jgi:hypothetical protein
LSWSDEFDDPVPGCTTLQDAVDHVRKLPKAQQKLPHWQTAVEMLIRAAKGSPAWSMLARIAMLKAMNRGRERMLQGDTLGQAGSFRFASFVARVRPAVSASNTSTGRLVFEQIYGMTQI